MEVYERLRELLDAHPATAPKAKSIDEILRLLFTPQEAAVATNMSFRARKPDVIAQASNLSTEETLAHLEAMANKGIIYSKNKDGKTTYGLAPLIPGVFEFPFMKGEDTPLHKQLGKLWEKYHAEALGASFAGNPTPLMRVVAVDKSIAAKDRVHPYEEVKRFISDASLIALANCACRVSVAGCDKPREACLIFDGAAEFLVERGFARQITREEGYKILDQAEAAGLVHTSNNSADKANLICNCCPCCCTILRGKTQLKHPHAFEPSRFEAQVNPDECSGCMLCAEERCPVKAVEMVDDVASVLSSECIGCGLCVSACPSGAIVLVERKQIPSTPATLSEMGAKVLQEKDRLEAFLKIMQH